MLENAVCRLILLLSSAIPRRTDTRSFSLLNKRAGPWRAARITVGLEEQVFAGVYRLAGQAKTICQACPSPVCAAWWWSAFPQSRSVGSSSMARAVMVLVAAVIARAARTSSTFSTLERLPRILIFSFRIGRTTGADEHQRIVDASQHFDGVQNAGRGSAHQIGRFSGDDLPVGELDNRRATPDAFLFQKPGSTTARSWGLMPISCMMRLILSTAS